MSIRVTFTTEPAAFALGRLLDTDQPVSVTLATTTPIAGQPFPLVWVTGDDREIASFERTVRDREGVESLRADTRRPSAVRYRIDWTADDDCLTDILVSHDAVVESAERSGHGTDWRFVVSFPDHALLTSFHAACLDAAVPLDVERLDSDPRPDPGGQASDDLSEKQREALALALSEGYFAVPRRTTLEALGDRLGISGQATSQRLRRGVERCVELALGHAGGDRGE
ncbi:helix-turn-helix domain-containing protein [Candidatus Halobonum tyrrellensis]|uniref:Putative DNA binding protein n=1 Tax=Candidatus Halobonum tyrrellensis G22 TaxID=1324957 RepID=V4HDZ2_9EURY|nr:helix-turn-helix domain-containing protein [Candidatus Halobonum tyrrellensis]ESP88875.1 putative DNA binding protein [Candidatus Halobonum tyrrellensis G22]